MLAVSLRTPTDICKLLAGRVRHLRLQQGLTQEELASRSGLSLGSLRRFEATGQINLERLLNIALVLGVLEPFSELVQAPPALSLAEMEAEQVQRKRGKRRRNLP